MTNHHRERTQRKYAHMIHISCMTGEGRSDHLIDILLAVPLHAAPDPLILNSSSSSMTYNTGWTHEDSCIIRADLPPRGGRLTHYIKHSQVWVCVSFHHDLKALFPSHSTQKAEFVSKAGFRQERQPGVCKTTGRTCFLSGPLTTTTLNH